MRTLLAKFVRNESGQDVIEYALLSAFIGLAAVAVFPLIQSGLNAAYMSWDGATQGLWEPLDPQ